MRRLFIVVSMFGVPLSAHAQNDPMAKHRPKLMARTLTDYQSKVAVQDDDLSTVAVISTYKAGRTKGHIPNGEGDVMLLAGINKSTGNTVFQVSATIGYWGAWRNYALAAYSTPAGPVQVQPKVDGRNVVACMSAAGCKLEERLSLTLDEPTMRSIATTSTPWRFRFQGNGPDWNEEMNPAEAGALLAAVDAYRAAHPVK